jgi:hypothetical protein
MKVRTNDMEYTFRDPIRNTVIRNKLNIFNLSDMIRNNGLNWIHHAERMETYCIPKQLVDCAHRGARSVGPSKLRWEDQHVWRKNGAEQDILGRTNRLFFEGHGTRLDLEPTQPSGGSTMQWLITMDLESTQPSGVYLPGILSLHNHSVVNYHGSGVCTTIQWLITMDLESTQPFSG